MTAESPYSGNEGTTAAVAFMQQPGKRDLLNRVSLDLATLKNTFQDHLRGITIDINEKGNRNMAGLFLLIFVFVALMFVAARTFRKAQKKMILNHLKFKQAQQIGKIGSWEWNFQTGRLKWSREQYRLFGVDPKLFEPSYDQYLQFLDPIEQHRTKRLINDTIDGIAEFSLEHKITRADGSYLYVFEQGTVLFDEKTGKPSGMFGITQDISDRKRDAEALQQARRKFEDIVDHAADGIYQSTPQGKFIMVNPSMAAIFG
ncbi:MAG: PAS domain-containing protein [Chitinophagaceae bacterium]|nr:PAS domain-containing protein [Chitinophagaceae bacterium]